MSDPYYPLAWVVYLGSVLTLFGMTWYFTRSFRPVLLRKMLRVTVLALVFTPAVVNADTGALAPAWLAFLFTAANHGLADARPTWVPLAAALAMANAVVIAAHIAGWPGASTGRPRRGRDGTEEHQPSANNTVDR